MSMYIIYIIQDRYKHEIESCTSRKAGNNDRQSQVSILDTPTIFVSFYIGYCRRLNKLLNYSNYSNTLCFDDDPAVTPDSPA